MKTFRCGVSRNFIVVFQVNGFNILCHFMKLKHSFKTIDRIYVTMSVNSKGAIAVGQNNSPKGDTGIVGVISNTAQQDRFWHQLSSSSLGDFPICYLFFKPGDRFARLQAGILWFEVIIGEA